MEGHTPSVTLSQIRLPLKAVSPLKNYSVQETVDLVRWVQEKTIRHTSLIENENSEKIYRVRDVSDVVVHGFVNSSPLF